MNFQGSLRNEIEYEINKMSLEELLYLELNPNLYIYSKLSPQIEKLKQLGNEINTMQEEFNLLKFQKTDFDGNLKEQFQKNYEAVNKLIEERKKLENKFSKNEFIDLLNNELKNFDNPDSCFNRFKDKKINYEEFKKHFSELGKEKNYYYYKLMYDKISNS